MFRTLITALTLLHLGPGIAFAVLAFGCDPADPVAGVLCRQDTIGAFVGITLGVWGVCLVGLGVMWLRRRLRSPSAGESAGGPPRAKA